MKYVKAAVALALGVFGMLACTFVGAVTAWCISQAGGPYHEVFLMLSIATFCGIGAASFILSEKVAIDVLR